MGDKGGKKNREKGQKQKASKHTKDLKEKKDKEPKSTQKQIQRTKKHTCNGYYQYGLTLMTAPNPVRFCLTDRNSKLKIKNL